MMAGVMALAMIGGPLVGGTITDHLGWRWSFYINLPLGAVALAMIVTVLHLPAVERAKRKIDYLGAALLTVGITSIVLVTTWGGTEYAWSSPVIMELIAIGVVTLVAFVYVQTKAPEPIVPLHIFRNRNFTLMQIIGFLTGFVMFGAVLFLPLYQQSVQGASATNSGLLLLPLLLSMMVVSLFAGRVTTNTGKYKIFPIAGSALMVVGLLLLAQMDTGTSRLTSGLYMAVLGAGMGFLMQITMLVAQNSAEPKDMGVASSTTTLFRTLGSSFGVAIMGALFTSRVQEEMTARGGDAVTQQSAQLDAASLAKLPEAAREAYQFAVASGTHVAFLVAGSVAVIGFLAAFFVKEVPLRGTGRRRRTPPRARRPTAAARRLRTGTGSRSPRSAGARHGGVAHCGAPVDNRGVVSGPCQHRRREQYAHRSAAAGARHAPAAAASRQGRHGPGLGRTPRPGRGRRARRVFALPLPARLQGGVRADPRPLSLPQADRARRGAAALGESHGHRDLRPRRLQQPRDLLEEVQGADGHQPERVPREARGPGAARIPGCYALLWAGGFPPRDAAAPAPDRPAEDRNSGEAR